MDKTDIYRMHQAWIEKCELSDRLNEWEERFVASVKQHLEKKGSLSPKQAEILERIYADKTD